MTLFLSHGAPDTALRDLPVTVFWEGLAATLPTPRALVVVSAHWEATPIRVEAASRPRTLHDFGGFAPDLYQLSYPAPGDPVLATRIVGVLEAAGLEAQAVERGFDHGVWVPLFRAWPLANVPVVPVSLPRRGDPYALGAALAPLAQEGVLVIGSGSATHNLGALAAPGTPPAPWARAFDDWLVARVEAGDHDALRDWVRQGPQATIVHPSREHFDPLLTALAAAGPTARGRVLHRSWDYGNLAMTAFQFP